jgi:hypothetical protein
MKEIREILARMVYEKDFDMGTTTVKELIDFLIEIGRECGGVGYDIGKEGILSKEKFLDNCFPGTQPSKR